MPVAAAPRPGRNDELRVWLGLLLAAAVFVGLGIVGRAWHPAMGKPLEPPWFPTPRALFDQVAALGPAGRGQHRISVLVLDTIIPLTYGWAMFRAARFYLRRLAPPGPLQLFRWLPVVAMLCDFAENACIVTLLNGYPREPSAVASALLAFAWTKWILLASTTVGILATWMLQRIREPPTT